MKTKPPLLTKPNKTISIVVDEVLKKEKNEIIEYFRNVIERITKKKADNVLVLTFVLRELHKLKKGQKISFDFGTKKVWELKRKK